MALSLSAVVVLAATLQGQAPELTRIPGDPSCRTCRVEAERILRLGTSEGEGIIRGTPMTIVRDSRGHYIIGESSNRGLPLIFDSTGRYLRRLARQGQGPAELVNAGIVFLARADSLYVYDWGTRRRSVFSPAWKQVRSVVQTAIGKSGVVLADGSLMLNSLTGPHALQLIDPRGNVVREFGGRDTIRAPEGLSGQQRHLAPGAHGTVWVAHDDAYRFARWSRDGRLLANYERINDFFRPGAEFRVQPSPAPPPRITSVHEDAAGRLWITTMVAAPRGIWEANLGEPQRTPRGGLTYPSQLRGRLFHTLVEVIDIRAGRLLASQRLPFYAVAVTRPGELAAYYETEDGEPFVDIWRIRLIQP